MFGAGIFIFSVVVSACYGKICYPCGEAPNRECFSRYLAKVAGCVAPIWQPADGQIFDVPDSVIEMYYLNATINRYKTNIQGIDRYNDLTLYVDDELDTTILSVNFPSVVLIGRDMINFHQAGKVDLDIDTAQRTTYVNLKVTAQYRGVGKITIGTARLYAEVQNSIFNLETDFPELAAYIGKHPDSIAAIQYNVAIGNHAAFLREEATPTGRLVARTWWNSYVCANLP